ncbi:MAG: 23S rRNA pseudouridine2457 synthase [Oleiphilaceae bacterium]|jgi:23S rRNA pseudouridine2457 synthase
MSTLYLLNKPFQVLSQFTDSEGRNTLANFIKTPKIYPAGRLDYDSEGLLILTGDGAVQARISDPKHKLPKTYWVQVEGIITEKEIQQLQQGVHLKDGKTKPAKAKKMNEPDIWTRTPPIRERANAQTSWLELSITEGRNRQVRRMTAEVGFPTLRLIRYSIGQWTLDGLSPGEHKTAEIHLPKPSSSNNNSRRKPHNKPKPTRKRNN